jgi:hypothetical protein
VTEDEIREFVGLLGQKTGEFRAGWVTCTCALAPWTHTHGGKDKSPTFGIKIEEGLPFVSCFACDFHGKLCDLIVELHYLGSELPLGALLAKLDGLDIEIEKPIANWEEQAWRHEEAIFPEWLREALEPAWCDGEVHPYLGDRGVPVVTAQALDICWDDFRQRIVFPVRDFKGRLRGLHGRSIYPHVEPRYRMYPFEKKTNPHVWLGEHWVDFEKTVVVTESVFDLARVHQVYENTVTPLRASLSVEQVKRMLGARKIITLFDNDKAGEKARSKMSLVLRSQEIVHLLPPEEFGDAGATPLDQLGMILEPHL